MSGLYKWAPPTWIFFHCFANKINKSFFENNRKQCLDIFKAICNALPCQECTKHATRYMNGVNANNVKTKEDLIHMLFVFHNSVNKRTGKKEASIDILRQYNNYRFDIVLINFLNGYSAKYGYLMNGIVSTLGRRKAIAKNVKNWMEAHWQYFQ